MTLTDDFFNECIKHPVPIDMRNGRSFIIANGDGCVRLDDVAGSSGIQGVNVAMGSCSCSSSGPKKAPRQERSKGTSSAPGNL